MSQWLNHCFLLYENLFSKYVATFMFIVKTLTVTISHVSEISNVILHLVLKVIIEAVIVVLLHATVVYFKLFTVLNISYYRPQTKLREGYVFTCVCDSVHRGGSGIPGCLAGHMTNQHYIRSCTVGGSR